MPGTTKLTIVSAADHDSALSLMTLLESIRFFEVDANVVVYDFGMTRGERSSAKELCSELRIYDFDKHPELVSKIFAQYDWKPGVIHEVAEEFGGLILWLDTGFIVTGKLTPLRQTLEQTKVYTPVGKLQIKDTLHPDSMKALGASRRLGQRRNRDAAIIGINYEDSDVKRMIFDWKNAVENSDFVSPAGCDRSQYRQVETIFSTLANRFNQANPRFCDAHLQIVPCDANDPRSTLDTCKTFKDPGAMVVIIATHRRPDGCRFVLESLSEAQRPAELKKVIVVENGDAQGVDQVVKDFESRLPISYVYHKVANKSAALNAALEEVEGNPLIVFFDDDVMIDSNCLIAYQKAAQELTGRSYFGGRTEAIYEREPKPWMIPSLPPSARGLRYDGKLGFTRRNILFLGFNWAVHKNLIKEAGGFDPRFGPGSTTGATGQESRIQVRLNEQFMIPGYYVPDAVVRHYVGAKTVSIKWILYRHYRNGLQKGLFAPRHTILNDYLRLRPLGEVAKSLLFALQGKPDRSLAHLSKFVFYIGRLRGKLISLNPPRD